MAESVISVSGSGERESVFARHAFLLRRLHSLTGIVPIGVFLINHLLTNSSIVWGGMAIRHRPEGGLGAGGVAYFWEEVRWINEQIPNLLLIEIALWGSIAFHSILGIYYATTGSGNTARYPYQSNWRYSLQRWSGYVGIFYILYHVATLRWGWTWLVPGGTRWDYMYSSSTLAAAMQGSPTGWTGMGVVVSLFYLLGVTLLVFHFANGLWTAAITWGLTISARAQRRWGWVCLALGAGLMAMAWSTLVTLSVMKPVEIRDVENGLVEPPIDATKVLGATPDAAKVREQKDESK